MKSTDFGSSDLVGGDHVSAGDRALLRDMDRTLYEARLSCLGPKISDADDLKLAVAWAVSALYEQAAVQTLAGRSPEDIAELMDRVKADVLAGKVARLEVRRRH
jgi:hypothetical protein